MISKNLNCIYIHIPKTGGMSIETILGADIKELHNKSIKIKHGYPTDWNYPKYWEKYYKFTFVRNPWDRVVSSYFYNLAMAKKKINMNDHDRPLNEIGFQDSSMMGKRLHEKQISFPCTTFTSGSWHSP